MSRFEEPGAIVPHAGIWGAAGKAAILQVEVLPCQLVLGMALNVVVKDTDLGITLQPCCFAI